MRFGIFWLFQLGMTLFIGPSCVVAALRLPNVVIFLADDAGWGDYSFTGNQLVSTPNIDRLAREGASFDRFFVSPVCSPTRAELLTGRYHPRAGVHGVSTGAERMNSDEKTLADAFAAAGYRTGIFGKWHNGSQWPYHPLARGFQEFFGYTSGHWGEYFDPPLEHNGVMVDTQGFIVDICTDQALRFITENQTQPFLCFVPFTTPHLPWAVPQKYWERFKDRPLVQQATEPAKENADETRCTLAMMENLDDNVGRVLQRLDELNLTKDTIVLYLSDNGPVTARWNDGMRGTKGSTDEGGVRSPLLIRWPGHVPAGRSVPQIAGAIDLLPTLLSLAQIDRVGNKPLDGRDLSPLLEARPVAWPERALFSSWAGKVSVRTQTHRLDFQGRLYDMVADPGQTQAINTQKPALTQQLQAAAAMWQNDVFASKPAMVQGRSVDPRAIDVGHRELPRAMLPARDGEPSGNIKRSANAPNSSYFVNWTSLGDAIVWNVKVVTPGRYQVLLDYTCPMADAGSTIELSFRDARLTGVVGPGWDPPLYTNQDTLPRPRNVSQMKPFKSLDLGVIELPADSGELRLRAIEIPGKSVMDLRRMTLLPLP